MHCLVQTTTKKTKTAATLTSWIMMQMRIKSGSHNNQRIGIVLIEPCFSTKNWLGSALHSRIILSVSSECMWKVKNWLVVLTLKSLLLAKFL